MSESTTRLYELGFILVPTTAEPEVPQVVDTLKALVGAQEGTVTKEGTPEFIDLAYTMEKTVGSKKQKYSQGYFGWMKLEIAPDALESLKKALDGEAALVRYILVKTNAANTVVFKKPKVEAKREALPQEEELLNDEMADDGLVEDQSLDHERLPSVEEDLIDTPSQGADDAVAA